MWHAGITGTKSEAARLVKSGGVYVASASSSGAPAEQEPELKFAQIKDQKPEDIESFEKDGLIVLRTGKWKVRVVEVVDDEIFESEGREAPGWAEWKESRKA
jgi:tyrosyl-tRNA synthetase